MQQPTLNPTPFAQNGQKNTIPDTASGGTASFSQGFPTLTMTPISQGGIPPSGQDFNGILNHLDSHVVWQSAGMGYSYDNTFANTIGGYAVGAVLRSKDGLSAYVNTVAGNKTDPESGQGWAVYAGGAFLKAVQTYQIGDIYTTTNSYADGNAVAVALGYGKWIRYAQGKVLLGYTDTPVTDMSGGVGVFNQMGQSVGEYAHPLTVAEMPSHKHSIRLSHEAATDGSRGDTTGFPWTNATPPFVTHSDTEADNSTSLPTGVGNPMGSNGGGLAHNNIQPSIVVAFWLRVAENYVAPANPPVTTTPTVTTSNVTTPATTTPTATTPATTSTVALNYNLAWGGSLTLTNLIQNVPDWQTGNPKVTEINGTAITHQAGQSLNVSCVSGGWSLDNGITLAVGADPEHTLTVTAVSSDIASPKLYPINSNGTSLNTMPSIANFWVLFEDSQNTVMVTCTLTLPVLPSVTNNTSNADGGSGGA